MQYHAIPCNTLQCHGSLITADGAYHCPALPFFLAELVPVSTLRVWAELTHRTLLCHPLCPDFAWGHHNLVYNPHMAERAPREPIEVILSLSERLIEKTHYLEMYFRFLLADGAYPITNGGRVFGDQLIRLMCWSHAQVGHFCIIAAFAFWM